MPLATSNNLLLVLYDAPNAFFPWTHDLLVSQKTMQKTLFPTLHPLSLIIFATATVVAFVLLRNSRFNFHCYSYTQCEATPTQKLAQKWRCNLSRLMVRKITKGIHSCKPASLNRPIRLVTLSILSVYSSIYSQAVWSQNQNAPRQSSEKQSLKP